MEEKINPHVLMSIEIGGKQIPFITDAVVLTWIIMAVLIILSVWMTKNLKAVPKGKQHVAEVFVGFINNLAKGQIGHRFQAFAPYLGTILLFLVFSNIIAIFNVLPTGEFLYKITGNERLQDVFLQMEPPTKNFNVTLCLALMSLAVTFIAEFRFRGIKGFFKGFYKPTLISGFIKTLDLVVRPMSLCLRLFGNIIGAFIVMTLVYSVAPFVFPSIVGIYFDLFDGILQAYVFVFLTSIYIAEAVETEE